MREKEGKKLRKRRRRSFGMTETNQEVRLLVIHIR
jgi:hypothetical protein